MFYKEIQCGTYSGYQRHYRLKEPSCAACKAGAVEYVRNYQKNNPEKMQANRRKYKKRGANYKERRSRQKSRRRARLKGSVAEPYTIEQVLELYGIVCYLCNKEIDLLAPRNCRGNNWQQGLHIDHVIDIQHGGSDTLDNVKPTHALCNVTKSFRNDEKGPTQDFS